ncbi:hypothetical protein ACB098_09G014800 [Castanea mollissima]
MTSTGSKMKVFMSRIPGKMKEIFLWNTVKDLYSTVRTNPQISKFSLIVSLSFVVAGYDSGFVSASMDFMKEEYTNLTDDFESLLMLIASVAGFVGGLLSIYLNNVLGKRRTLYISNFIFVTAYVVHVCALTPWMLALSRCIVGTATAIVSTTAPLLVSQPSPKSIRGILVGLLGMFYAVGLFSVNLMTWTMDAIEDAEAVSTDFYSFFQSIVSSFRNVIVRQALLGGICVHVVKRISGSDAIIYFAPEIFDAAGYKTNFAPYVTILGILGPFVSLFIVDVFGRKPILVGSLACMLISLITMFVETYRSVVSVFSIILFYLYVFANALGYSTIPIILNSEIYPSGFRVLGAGIAISANYFTTLIVSLLFPKLVDWLGMQVFSLYAMFCGLALVVITLFVPETMNTNIEEMEDVMLEDFTEI